MYENGKPLKVTSVVISTQHSKDLNQQKVKDLIIPYINKSIRKNYLEGLELKSNLYKSDWTIHYRWTRWGYWINW